jgi:hypothetical protein
MQRKLKEGLSIPDDPAARTDPVVWVTARDQRIVVATT